MSDDVDLIGSQPLIFPALESLVRTYRPHCPKPHLTLITHLLPTARNYIATLSRVFDVKIIGIPYSTSRGMITWLRDCGYSVIAPDCIENVGAAGYESVAEQAMAGKAVMVQEIGGYLAEFAATLGKFASFLGVVEDTSNGHWRYVANEAKLSYPVISIAKSPIKAMEDIRIGDAVVFSIERALRESFRKILRGCNVLVLGFGSVGRACAQSLRSRGSIVSVFDVDAVKEMQAYSEGFTIGCLSNLLGRSDVIVGATGHCSIDCDCVPSIKEGAILISASSKRSEFMFEKECIAVTRAGNNVHRYTDNGRFFYVLSGGFPINFEDGSVIGGMLDAIYCELFVCLREIAERRLAAGLRMSWPAIHYEVAEAWCRAYISESQ